MADSAHQRGREALLTPSVNFRDDLKVHTQTLVSAAHQKYAFDQEGRARAIAGIARTEIARIRQTVETRLELLTRPLREAEPGQVASEDTRITRQIMDMELRISREVISISDIILQIPNLALQQELGVELIDSVEGVPIV